jgi:hypothetical protein
MDCKSRNNKQIQHFNEAFSSLPNLTELQKVNLKNRFISLLQEYTERANKYSVTFHSLRIIISVGSLIVPAILSVQIDSSNQSTVYSTNIYWIVWVLSLCVTISNALMTLMKIDKKYYILHTTLHHIISEGWLYIELSGKYSGFKTPGQIPTHQNQYVYFCHSLEKTRMKQVEDEYYKLTEINNASVAPSDPLVPPTPLKAITFAVPPTTPPLKILQQQGQKSQYIVNGLPSSQAEESEQVQGKTTVRRQHAEEQGSSPAPRISNADE